MTTSRNESSSQIWYAHEVSLAKQWGKNILSIRSVLERSLVGTSDDIIARIQGYVDADVTHFTLDFVVETPNDFLQAMKLFAQQIMPCFVRN